MQFHIKNTDDIQPEEKTFQNPKWFLWLLLFIQDGYDETVNQQKFVKNPNWQKKNKLAIYKVWRS